MNETTDSEKKTQLVTFGRNVHKLITQHLGTQSDAKEKRVLVLAMIGESTWRSPAILKDHITNGMSEAAEAEGNEYKWLSIAIPSTGDPSSFEHALVIALVRSLLQLEENSMMRQNAGPMLATLQARSWSVGLRDAIEQDFKTQLGELSTKLLAVWEPDNLKVEWSDEMMRAVRWVSAAAGIRAVALRSRRYLESADLLLRLPEQDQIETAQALSNRFRDDTKEIWKNLIANYLARNGVAKDSAADVYKAIAGKLAEIIERAAALHLPAVLDLARLKGRLQVIALSLNKMPEEEGFPDKDPTTQSDSANQRSEEDRGRKSLRDEIEVLCSRICFLLVMGELRPDLAAKVCDDFEGAFNLYRLQLAFLRDQRSDQPAAGLLDEEWTRTFVQDDHLRRLFVELMTRRRADGAVDGGAGMAALCAPFQSVQSLVQHADLVFGRVSYFRTDTQKAWEEWLVNLGKYCEKQWRQIKETIKKWRLEAVPVEAFLKEISEEWQTKSPRCAAEAVCSTPSSGGDGGGEKADPGDGKKAPLAPCELRAAFDELKKKVEKALNAQRANSKVFKFHDDEAIWPNVEVPPLVENSQRPKSSEINVEFIKTEANPAELLGVGPRLLTCAEIAFYAKALAQDQRQRAQANGGDGGSREWNTVEKWCEEVEKRLESWCGNYDKVAFITRGRVQFELSLVRAQILAALHKFVEAEKQIENLGDELDALRKAHVRFVQAWVKELSNVGNGRDGIGLELYREVEKEARALGAHELSSRAARRGMRSAMLRASKPDPWVRFLWAASAAAALNAERSPRVARMAGMWAPVFVSYKRQDFGWVAGKQAPGGVLGDLIERLGQEKDLLWIDRFAIDDDTQEFGPLLSVALQNAAGVLVLFSKNYFKSEWCRWELEVAAALARQGSVRVEFAFCGEGGKLLEKENGATVSRKAHCDEVRRALSELDSDSKNELSAVAKDLMDQAMMRSSDMSLGTLESFVRYFAETGSAASSGSESAQGA